MGTRFSFSIPLENIKEYARKVIELPPLPEFIVKRGPYIHDVVKIMVVYEFDKSKIEEAWEIISQHLDAFISIPGFTLHSHILEKGKGIEGPRFALGNQSMARPFFQNSQTFE